MTNLGKMLKLLRQYKDTTQVEFAKEIGIDKTALNQLENGRRKGIGNTATFLNILTWLIKEYDHS